MPAKTYETKDAVPESQRDAAIETKDPELIAARRRFAQLRLLRWRAIRIELDVALHTRGLSPDDAAARLRDDVGLSGEAALAEIRRQCAMPTYAASYAAGRREILVLREAARTRQGAGFSLRDFHDALLAYGRLPIALAGWGMGLA